jgi:hypothetical protein
VHGNVDRGVEAEANAFAAELLMPERLLRGRCEVSPVSLDRCRSIAREFNVSLIAAALRFVELTSERCALVVSRKREIAWAARSVTFAPFIERRRLLGRDSVAIDWSPSHAIATGPQLVPADAWVDHDGDPDDELWEDSTAIAPMTSVLTLLWIPEALAGPFDRA